jgi:hypothetical protein
MRVQMKMFFAAAFLIGLMALGVYYVHLTDSAYQIGRPDASPRMTNPFAGGYSGGGK